ncbi:hypothetical protein CR161_11095 [Prosthecochloris sp. ZM]|uniref:glycosyltransferase family 39 protein n=1 Tax=Prosthecochloris sp. ZM TaxID=2283143 RepID=UPI000DF84972|nr:glycosyltransferase family 39 protein [Prosthecochloris sp. ZM]RDD31196.1 hypothetical protein CR161_11095 [Prosthecochloris sp. ZM]
MSDTNWLARNRVLVTIAAVAIVAGVLLRLWPGLVDRPLWYDEVRTWQTAFNPAWHEFFLSTIHKEHPPLSYLFVRCAMEIFGPQHFWAMRLPSLLFGLLCIPAAYAFGKTLMSSRAGIVFAVLVAINPLLIDQSHQARMYTLFMFLLILVIRQLVLASDRNTTSSWVVFGLLAGLLGWSHQLAMVVWPGLMIGILFLVWDSFRHKGYETSRLLKHVWLSAAVALIVNLPPLLLLIRRLLAKPRGFDSSAVFLVSKLGELLDKLLGDFPLYLFVLSVAIVGLYFLYKNGFKSLAVTLAAIAMFTLIAQIPLSRLHHVYSSRYLIPLLFPVWVGLLAAMKYTPSGFIQKTVVAVVILFSFHSLLKGFDQTLHKLPHMYQYGTATEFVLNSYVEDEAVLYFPSYMRHFCQPYGYRHPGFEEANPCVRSKQYFVLQDSLGRSGSAGLWWVVRPSKIFKSTDSEQKFIAQLERIASGFDLDFHISDPATLPRKGPLIFHFMPDSLDIFTLKAVSVNEAEVLSLSRDVIR